MKDSFVIYKNFAEASRKLPAEQFKEYYELVFDYVFNGIQPKTDNIAIDMLLVSCLPMIDRSINNYEHNKENSKYGVLGKKYGNLGGRPRKGETKEEYQTRKESEKPPKTPFKGDNDLTDKKTPKNPLNVNDNVNENGNVNGNGIGPLSSNPEKEKDGKEIGLTTSTSIDYKEKEGLDNPIVSPSDSLYSNVGNNTGKISNEYYQTIKGSDNSESIVDYMYKEVSRLMNLMVEKYKLTNRDFDNEYWEMFNTCVAYLQELRGYDKEVAKQMLNGKMNKQYQIKKNEQFAQPVISVPSFKDI